MAVETIDINRVATTAMDTMIGDERGRRHGLSGVRAIAAGAALATAAYAARGKHLPADLRIGRAAVAKLVEVPSVRDFQDAIRDRFAEAGLIDNDDLDETEDAEESRDAADEEWEEDADWGDEPADSGAQWEDEPADEQQEWEDESEEDAEPGEDDEFGDADEQAGADEWDELDHESLDEPSGDEESDRWAAGAVGE